VLECVIQRLGVNRDLKDKEGKREARHKFVEVAKEREGTGALPQKLLMMLMYSSRHEASASGLRNPGYEFFPKLECGVSRPEIGRMSDTERVDAGKPNVDERCRRSLIVALN
jgi:hypothetical protein